MSFYTFEEFLNESLEVNTMIDATKAFLPLLKEAKDNGIIKAFTPVKDLHWKYHNNYDSVWRNQESLKLITHTGAKFHKYLIPGYSHKTSTVYKIVFNNNSYAEVFFYDLTDYTKRREKGEMINYSFSVVCVWKNDTLSSNIVKKIFNDTINGSLKNITWEFKRKDIKSKEIENMTSSKIPYGMQSIAFLYSSQPKMAESTISLKDIQSTQEYKDLMSITPIQLISTDRQLKNKTLVFAFETSSVFGDHHDINAREKFLRSGFSIYDRGYIKKNPTWGYDQQSPVSNFDSNTLEGWKKALVIVKDKFIKYIEKLQKEGLEIYYTPEDLEKKKGKITGRKYGI